MSFFKDFKEDLSMAVNELMPDEAESGRADGSSPEDGPKGKGGFQPEDDLAQAGGLAQEDDFTQADDYLRPEDFLKPENFQEKAGSFAAAQGEESPEALAQELGMPGDIASEPETSGYMEQEPGTPENIGSEPEISGYMAQESPAVREDMWGGGPTGEEAQPEGKPDEEYSPLEEELKQAFAAGEENSFAEPAVPENEKNTEIKGEETMNEDLLTSLETEELGQTQQNDMEEAVDENAIITEGMTITGDIAAKGSIEITGTVNGNIDVLGKIVVTGKIQGNSKAAEFYAESAKITGQIVSTGSVKVGQSSVIIGDIGATSAVIAGAVKGDIDVQGPVILDSTAIVMGNIKSKSIQINNGAVIEGMCSQCYAEVSPTNFFDDVK